MSVETVTTELFKTFRERDQHWPDRTAHSGKLMKKGTRGSKEEEETNESSLNGFSDMDTSDVFDVTDRK